MNTKLKRSLSTTELEELRCGPKLFFHTKDRPTLSVDT
jgi:hypothetical protein